MYFGHYGVGLALKKFGNGLSLGWLFLSVQFVDLLAMTLMLLRIEIANVVPGFTATSSMEYVYFPYSHSLVAFLVWALIFYAIFRFVEVKPGLKKSRIAVVVALGVLSHFVLDVIVHIPDLPVFWDDSFLLGLGLWNFHPIINFTVEGVILLVGLFVYLKSTVGSSFVGRYGLVFVVGFMFVLNGVLMFGQTLPDLGVSAALYLVFNACIILSAFWLDNKRE